MEKAIESGIGIGKVVQGVDKVVIDEVGTDGVVIDEVDIDRVVIDEVPVTNVQVASESSVVDGDVDPRVVVVNVDQVQGGIR
ncbi:MAG TPA: hypothetical protein VFQ43_19595 [Nitrososphaera sp.]|nr:hypothetical protein [Nitrososphaera sp.]